MDTKSLTYGELGQALGITPASAKRLAIRRRWPKALGNNGRTRVAVPVEYLETSKPTTDDITKDNIGGDTGGVTSDATGDITHALSILSQHIVKLEEELAELRQKASDRDMLAGQLEGLRSVLEVERKRGEELRSERNKLLDRLMTPPEPKAGFLDRLRRAFG